MEISPEFFAEPERIEQWASTAKLRRLEVERIEARLAEMAEPFSPPWPDVCYAPSNPPNDRSKGGS